MSAKVLFEGNYSRYRSTLMGVAMLSIMLSHQRFVHVFPINLFMSFGHWGVDIFLFLSGMGMVGSLMAHTVKEFYYRRFKRLIPLCVLCGAIKYGVFLLSLFYYFLLFIFSSIFSMVEVLSVCVHAIILCNGIHNAL